MKTLRTKMSTVAAIAAATKATKKIAAMTAAKMLAAKTMAIAAAAVLAAAIMTGCMDAGLSDYDPSSSAEGSSSTPGGNDNGPQAGTLTAGEWCDLANWDFWTDLLKKDKYAGFPRYWRFYTGGRYSVDVKTADNQPVVNAKVALQHGETTLWQARTSNTGRAELWLDLNYKQEIPLPTVYEIYVNDEPTQQQVGSPGVTEVVLPAAPAIEPKIELAFMVDATGSMRCFMQALSLLFFTRMIIKQIHIIIF